MSINLVITTLAFFTVLSHVLIVITFIYLLFFRNKYPFLLEYFSKNSIQFALVIALISTASSLFFSEVAGFIPCTLCWYQRVFMYPEVIILGVALFKKDKNILTYAIPVAIIGIGISAYQNIVSALQIYSSYNTNMPTMCSVFSGISCLNVQTIGFGYITIPVMAFTGFLLIIILLLLPKIKITGNGTNTST